jgi:8-oxo-dGTP pyrophosphatase MutT (NUDIX family)
VQVVYARQPFPASVHKTIFLAGPTPRSPDVPSWRPRALELLREFDGHVFSPEDPEGGVRGDYDDQIEWELAALSRADCILFWLPRKLDTMPALTTNVEFGLFAGSGRAVFGAPPDAEKVRYLIDLAKRRNISVCDSLEELVAAAVKQVGEGAPRSGGECSVPSLIYRSPAFQSWYAAQRAAGNELVSARVEYVLRTGPKKDWLFLWALAVDVYIPSEKRNKKNEVVVGRPDASQVVLLHRREKLLESEVILVREFRSAARTADGFVRETPGGSSFTGVTDPQTIALEEVHEEVGLQLPSSRMTFLGSRQLAATLLSHHAHLFFVEITDAELARLVREKDESRGAGHSEMTWLEIRTIGSLIEDSSVDWSTLGMILGAVIRSP